MTGPEHYRAAESWRRTALDQLQDDEPKSAELHLRFAQVHATLALAAATAMTGLPITPQERQAWWDMGSAA